MTTPNAAHAETPRPTLGSVFEFGGIYRCRSDRFGINDLLAVKSPGHTVEERVRFLPLRSPLGGLLFFSSASKDIVEKSWPSLDEYYAEKAETELQAERRRGDALAESLKAFVYGYLPGRSNSATRMKALSIKPEPLPALAVVPGSASETYAEAGGHAADLRL